MITRQRVGWVGMVAVIAFGLATQLIGKTDWPAAVSFSLVAVFALSCWFIRPIAGTSKKVWDFQPKRGALYFLGGLIIFPFTVLIGSVFGQPVSLAGMVMFTLVMSVLAGLAGMFTENVGV